jgi:negative regulator of flagellin synthesis FlgM
MESTMKIGNSPEIATPGVATDKPGAAQAGRAQAQAAATKSTGTPEASAQIELSSAATSLLSGISDEGSFDAEKVERISQAIAQGKFSINADAIADKLIANAQELLVRVQPH